MPDRLYDPKEITRRSYEYIDRNLDLNGVSSLRSAVIRRVVHTTGDFDLENDLWFTDDLESVLPDVLDESFPIVTDVTMVQSGIRRSLLDQAGLETTCFVHDDRTRQRAREEGLTRSAAGLDRALDSYHQFVLVVGNAPTVLFRLLDREDATPDRIPLVVGAPVGFVSVEESKRELSESSFESIGVRGHRGGSPVAASITNALIQYQLETSNE